MKKIKSLLSISRRSDHDGNHFFAIEATDELSGLRVITCLVPAKEFALAISGFSGQSCESDIYPVFDLVGLKREIKRISMQKPVSYHKPDISYSVLKHFDESGLSVDGWSIHSDGTREQQNGSGHNYSLIRFVPAES